MSQVISLRKLKHLGFIRGLRWTMSGDRPIVAFESEARSISPAIYAFVVEDAVVYIGKSTGSFAARMLEYQSPTQEPRRTTYKNRERVKAELLSGRRVYVYVLKAEYHEWNGIRLDIASALEVPLMNEPFAKPIWNGRAK